MIIYIHAKLLRLIRNEGLIRRYIYEVGTPHTQKRVKCFAASLTRQRVLL